MLPLMMTYELCDITFFLTSLSSPSTAFNICNFVSFSSSSTRSNGIELNHRFCRSNKSRHFYFSRLPRLWNALPTMGLLSMSLSQAKNTLKIFFINHFVVNFSSLSCSFHFLCPCCNCNSLSS